MNSILSLLWWGHISVDLLVMGTIDALIVSLIVAAIVIYFIKHTTRLEELNTRLKGEIAERVRLAEELGKSEQLFKTIFNDATDGILLADTDTMKFQSANKMICEMLGYSPDELQSLSVNDIHPAEDLPHVIEQFERQVRGEGSLAHNIPVKRKDGSIFYADINASAIKLTDRNVMIGIFRDITNHKRASEKLMHMTQQLRILSSAGQQLNADLDMPVIMRKLVASAIEVVNATSGTAGLLREGKMVFTEYNESGRLNPIDYSFNHGDGVPGLVMETKRPYVSNDAANDPHVIPEIQQKLGFYNLLDVPIISREGTLLGCFEIYNTKDRRHFNDNDIFLLQGLASSAAIALENAHILHERIEAMKALRRSEENFRALFEESRDVIYVSTPEGRFLDINPAGTTAFGYDSREELLAIDISRQLYENPSARDTLWKTMEQRGFVRDYEVRLKRKDGEIITVLVTSTLVRNKEGNIVAHRGIMRDITERLKLEEQLRQSQKMEAVGQLAGGVAHDFNNILSAIIGYANLIQMKVEEGDPVRLYLDQILASSERAAVLVQSLLAFSRKQVISLQAVDLNEIVKKIGTLLHRVIGEDVKLETILSEGELTVLADTGQIEQVLMNLATNARDAMPEGGLLIVETEAVDIDEEFIKSHEYGKPGRYALLSVTDSGEGMDEETKAKIFEPFFTTKEMGRGTGLGLSMVYGIVKQHEGYIDVYSEEGKGTKFKIYLPLKEAAVRAGAVRETEEMLGGSETVLVAEDDEALRRLTRDVLERYGYTILEAEDGLEALEQYRMHGEKVDLLVLDVIMPRMNGREVYEEIRKMNPAVKVLFLSGYSEDIIHRKGILEEGLNFVLKPVPLAQLLRKVRSVLDS